MYKAQIADRREKAGRALQEARRLGKLIAENPAGAGEHEEAFGKAKADFDAGMQEIQRLEGLEELEVHHEAMSRPVGNVPVRGAAAAHAPTEEHARKHREAFNAYVRSGERAAVQCLEGMGPKEINALLGNQGDLGGFLVPEDFQAEVIKDLAGFAVIRPVARVMRTGRDELVMPSIQSATTDADIYSTGYTGGWKSQGYVTGGTAPTVQNQPKFGQVRIPVHSWEPDAVEVGWELVEDSAANIEEILRGVIVETRANDEDSAFINGNGINKPLGLLSAGLTAVNSGSAAAITYDGLIDLTYNLPAQYRQNAAYLMNSLTFGAVLKLKDSQNMPLITPNTVPGTLWNKKLLFSEFMPDQGANTYPVVFGDFRYYGIADRMELRVQRLVERYAPNVGILPMARLGGQVLRTAAFRTQKCST